MYLQHPAKDFLKLFFTGTKKPDLESTRPGRYEQTKMPKNQRNARMRYREKRMPDAQTVK